MRFKTKLLLLICFISIFSFSQNTYNQKKDSIISRLISSIDTKKEDSVRFYYNKFKKKVVKKENYKEHIKVINKTGHFYDGLGYFEKSIEIYQSGLLIAESYFDYPYQSTALVNISHTYRIFHNYEKAINYGKKAEIIIPKDSSKQNLLLKADALNVIAAAFTENKKPDSALVYQEKVLSFLPIVDSTEIKNTFVNIGYTYMELNQLKKAKNYTLNGLNLYKPTKSVYALASIYTNLAMYGRRAKKYDYALKMFDTAIYYTKKSNYIETYVWIYEERAQVYKSLNKHKKALEDLEKLTQIKDSVFRNKRAKTAQETEAKYQTIKKEKEIIQQKEQLLEQELAIKNRNLYAILLASALLILAIIFFSIYKRNQLKRRQLQKEIDLKDALSKIKTQNRLQEQRLRISRDLHDNIGSQLTFIISSIDNLKYVSKDANIKLKDKLSKISSFTGDTIHQLRDTIWAMNKNEITVEDLHSRILSFIEKAKTAVTETEFEIVYDIDKNSNFSSLVGMNIFRVIQEAINNAIKYADANKIEVQISKTNQNFVISIIDNGKGFDMNTVALGNGLSNMEKRMSEIDAKIHIKSQLSKGTHIQIICNL
jgi:signal transduction histidine kinase